MGSPLKPGNPIPQAVAQATAAEQVRGKPKSRFQIEFEMQQAGRHGDFVRGSRTHKD